MLFVKRTETDPYFNIAAEEYAVKSVKEDIVMLWQSTDSVIVGKHQIPVKEVNIPFVFKSGIPVIRRISGGGTVFHSSGNINYSVITTHKNQNNLIDFKKFTKTIIEFLLKFGVKADFEGKNNLCINGKKFSGNSAHIFKNRIIHHGTILFDVDLELLENTINPTGAELSDKSIGSIRKTVTNIKPFLNEFDDTGTFLNEFENHLIKYHNVEKKRGFTEREKAEITKLANEKYRSFKWIWDYSPDYHFKKQKETDYGIFSVNMDVSKGIISDIRLFFEGKRLENIEKRLKGKRHEPNAIFNELNNNRFTETITEVLF